MKDPRVYLAHILESINRIEFYTVAGRDAFLSQPMIHDYAGVDLHEVWRVIRAEMAQVKAGILAILPPLDQLEAELAGEGEEGDQP